MARKRKIDRERASERYTLRAGEKKKERSKLIMGQIKRRMRKKINKIHQSSCNFA